MSDLRERFHFHLEHGGYATPPGRAACALERAKAEQFWEGREDVRVLWEYDDTPDVSWDESGVTLRRLESGEWESLGCVIERRCPSCGEWQHVTSLWGIIGPPDDPYHRIVEADLLLELPV